MIAQAYRIAVYVNILESAPVYQDRNLSSLLIVDAEPACCVVAGLRSPKTWIC